MSTPVTNPVQPAPVTPQQPAPGNKPLAPTNSAAPTAQVTPIAPTGANAPAIAAQNATAVANSASNLATPVLASPEAKAAAIKHVTEVSNKLQPIIGKPGYNVFIKLTPTLSRLSSSDCTTAEVDAAMRLDDKPETYAVVMPVPVGNSPSPMVQALVEGAAPVAPFATRLG